jgi:hypothetical protein
MPGHDAMARRHLCRRKLKDSVLQPLPLVLCTPAPPDFAVWYRLRAVSPHPNK